MEMKMNYKNSNEFIKDLGCKVFDTHAHIHHFAFPLKAWRAEEVSEIIDGYMYDYAVVSSGLAILDDMVEGNARMVQDIEPLDNLLFYVTINANKPKESIEEIKKYRNYRKFAGLKHHPNYSGKEINYKGAMEILEYFGEGVVLAHTYREPSISAMCQIAGKFPQINFIMGHMGGLDWQNAVDKGAEHSNIYFEPNCSYPEYDKLYYAVRKAGEDRVVFGSDVNLVSPSFTLGMVASSELSKEIKRKIIYDNGKNLFLKPLQNL